MKTNRIVLLGAVFIISLAFVGAALAGASQTQKLASTVSAPNTQQALDPEGGFSPAEVLLVDDDDNTPDVLPVYTQILDALGYSYNVWNTGNSDFEPDFATLHQHQAVIWFTGHEFGGFAGPSSASEVELAAYLDNGGCMFLSSQDYYNDRGLTSFMQNYLGVASVSNDLGDYLAVNGQGSVYNFLGPYSLIYPFTDFSDIVTPDTSAQLAFQGVTPNTNPAGVYKNGGSYKTTFLGFPLEALPGLFDQGQTISRFLFDCFPNDVMLVDDDDNSPDVRNYYTQVLDQLGYHYTVWDTDNSDFEPTVSDLASYEAVVWFSGDEFDNTAGPDSQSEAELASWLDAANACFFLSSQDYLYDRGLTPFMTNYLGVLDGVNDVGQAVITGTETFGAIGPFSLTMPMSFSNYSDAFTMTSYAQTSFLGDKSTYSSGKGDLGESGKNENRIVQSSQGISGTNASHAASSYVDTGTYHAAWLGFPFEAIPSFLDQLRTMNRFLSQCFEADIQTIKATSDPVVQVGQSFTYTVQVVNHGPHRAVDVLVQDFVPNHVTLNGIGSAPGVSCNSTPGNNVKCTIPDLLVGQTEVIELYVTANLPGEPTNFVFSTNFGADPNPLNNSTSAFVRVLQAGDTDLYLDSVTPNVGASPTGANVQIQGANFQAGTQIFLDSTELISITFDVDNPDARLTATIPAGFPPGTYHLRAENPGGDFDILYKGMVVYDPNALDVDNIIPDIGPNDRPVTLNIFGDGFAPGMTGKLVDSTNSQIFYALETPAYISGTLVRATVPHGIPAGIYDVRLYNPVLISATLPAAYEAIEWAGADDLLAYDFDLFTIPASPREGDNVVVGLTVRRRTGEFAPFASGQVSVDASLGISGSLTTAALTLGGSAVISPNQTISITFPWTPGPAGDYQLSFDISSLDLVTDTIPENNHVEREITVLPPSTDPDPPVISSLTINGGAIITSDPAVILNTAANDTASGLAYIYYIDYAFDRNLGDWMPVNRSGWLPFASASVDFDWVLEPTYGVHYIQAWVSDSEGNISLPFTMPINFIATKNHIVHDGGQIFRLLLPPGLNLQIDLTSLVGDADMFAWGPSGNLVAASFGSTPFEQLTINSGINPPGIYQIDVYGFEATSYWFEVSLLGTLDNPVSLDEIRGHVKGSDTPLQVIDNSPTGDVDVPPPPEGGWVVFLPVIAR